MAKVSGPNVSQAQQAQKAQQAEFKSPNGKAPEGKGELHAVVQGDTMSGIAEAKLGDAQRWGEIAELNPQVKNPDLIYPGDQLRMPDGARKLNEAEVDKKTGQVADGEVAQNFVDENKGKTTDLPKKSGVLNFLSNKIPAKEMDSSVAQAIDGLKKHEPPISGEIMQQAVVDGTKDLDNSAAGKEFDQLSGFVKDNYDKFSPDAKAKFRVYEKYAKRAQKQGMTGIPQNQYDKMVGEMGKAGYLDSSSGAAVEQLRTEKKPISGEAMQKAIVAGAVDHDNSAAGNEFKDLRKFTKKNWDKLSPEAQQKFEVYEKTARSAQKQGDTGIPQNTWDKMVAKMDTIGARPVDAPGDKTLDASVAGAIDYLKSQQTPISGAAMQRAIEGGVGDFDAKSAGEEHQQLKRFVNSNKSKFSPEAQATWDVFDKQATALAKAGKAGFDDASWSQLQTDMRTAASGKPQVDTSFDWGNVPVDARSPELQQVLTELQAQAGMGPGSVPAAQRPDVQDMLAQQAQAAQLNPALMPDMNDPETAMLAKGMGMKPPLSFEDQMFLMQMKYAAKKEREILTKMNELAGGSGMPGTNAGINQAPGNMMMQNGQPVFNNGSRPPNPLLGQEAIPQGQVDPQLAQYMQQQAQYQAQQQGHIPQQNLTQPQNPLPQQTQQNVAQIIGKLEGAVAAYESPGSEGGEMITVNEMQNLVGLARQLPPDLQQMVKAEAYKAAVTEGGLTPEAFSALMAYVNEDPAVQAQQTGGVQTAGNMPGVQGPGGEEEKPYDPTADAVALRESMRGMGTDESKLFKALDGKTPEQMAQLKAAYQQMNGKSLEADLRGDLSGPELRRAQALLGGQQAKADAAALRVAMHGNYSQKDGTDEATIFNTLEGKNPDQLKAIAQEYQAATGKTLQFDLDAELSGAELKRANASLQGNPAAATAMALSKAMKGNYGFKAGTDEAGIFKALENVSPEQLPHVAAEYQKVTGRNLQADLTSELSGQDLTRAMALLGGNRAAADASVLRKAMKGMGTDEDAIFNLLQGKSQAERQAILGAYQQVYSRDLAGDLRSELSRADLSRAMQLLMQAD